jgi:hypothetical protein
MRQSGSLSLWERVRVRVVIGRTVFHTLTPALSQRERVYSFQLAPPGDDFMRFRVLLSRALRLRCPLCGQGRLFRKWLIMHAACPHCGATFEREPGFFLGSIYINYGLTALIVAIAYPLLLFNGVVGKRTLLIGALAFTVVFPIFIFPWARSLWLGFDQWRDPRPGEITSAGERGASAP